VTAECPDCGRRIGRESDIESGFCTRCAGEPGKPVSEPDQNTGKNTSVENSKQSNIEDGVDTGSPSAGGSGPTEADKSREPSREGHDGHDTPADTLDREDWCRILDALDLPSYAETVDAVTGATDRSRDHAEDLLDAALQDGPLVEDPDAGVFGAIRLANPEEPGTPAEFQAASEVAHADEHAEAEDLRGHISQSFASAPLLWRPDPTPSSD
jgi:hypothetical protein